MISRNGTSSPAKLALAEAVEAYLGYLATEKQLEKNTLFHYRHDLTLFLRFLERELRTPAARLTVSTVTGDTVEAFIKHQTEHRRNGVASNRRRLSCLRGFVRFLVLIGAVAGDFAEVPLPPHKRMPPTFLRPHEEAALLQAARHAAPNPPRDYAIFLLFLKCGCRLNEVLNMQMNDIDWPSGTVNVRNGNRIDRTLPLGAETHAALAEYLECRPRVLTPYLFLNRHERPITKGAIYHALSKCLSAAGINRPRITLHTLRHTYVKRLVDANTPLHRLLQLTGTRTPAAFRIYQQVRETDRGGPYALGPDEDSRS